jgi:hypothetical protein
VLYIYWPKALNCKEIDFLLINLNHSSYISILINTSDINLNITITIVDKLIQSAGWFFNPPGINEATESIIDTLLFQVSEFLYLSWTCLIILLEDSQYSRLVFRGIEVFIYHF